jgi:hypothetical protein
MFRTRVIMGAALGAGCGPQAPPSDQDNSSGSGPGSSGDATSTPGSTAPNPSVPGDPSQATTVPADPSTTSTTDAASTTVHSATSDAPTTGAPSLTTSGTTGPPDDPSDCASPQQFKCDDNWENCICNPDAPLTPDDCRGPEQFICWQQWQDPPWGCECDPNAPATPEDCPFPINFNCWEYDPIAIGCHCECVSYGPPNPQNEADCAQSGPFWCTHEPVACCCQIQLG